MLFLIFYQRPIQQDISNITTVTGWLRKILIRDNRHPIHGLDGRVMGTPLWEHMNVTGGTTQKYTCGSRFIVPCFGSVHSDFASVRLQTLGSHKTYVKQKNAGKITSREFTVTWRFNQNTTKHNCLCIDGIQRGSLFSNVPYTRYLMMFNNYKNFMEIYTLVLVRAKVQEELNSDIYEVIIMIHMYN